MARRHARGFTLIELLVSLAAGLIIAVAVAGLSKVATTTFYEESRLQAAELTLRVAAERLRSDLSRASYMGTPNILTDPLLVLPTGASQPTVATTYPSGLGLLAGVRYLPDTFAAGDVSTNIVSMSTYNLRSTPDRLIIGGNMTTADEYIVQSVLSGGSCGGFAVTLSLDSPAIARLVGNGTNATTAVAALTAAFAPATASGSTAATWMARLVDDTGKRQFVALCPAPVAMTGGAPVISISPGTPVLTAAQTGAQGGESGFGVGRLTINPIQLVEWSVRDNTAAAVAVAANNWAKDKTITNEQPKFDLVRQYLDATGARIGNPELIAEYLVDFEIGLVVENSTAGAAPRMQVAAFDNATSALVLQNSSPKVGGDTTQGPQWVRSLRYRMATRAPIADRALNLAPPAGTGYAYRYCTLAAGCGTTQSWARVRTLTGEVTLQNQARYP